MKNSRKRFPRISRRLAVAALAVGLLGAGAATMAMTRNRALPQATTFELRTLDGQTVSSNSLRGKVVVLVFGASWLPLSQEQVKGVQSLSQKYAGQGVAVYWVSTDSSTQKSKNYASDSDLERYTQRSAAGVKALRDPDGTVLKQFNVDQLPSLVILDKAGSVVGQPLDGYDPSEDLVKRIGSQIEKQL